MPNGELQREVEHEHLLHKINPGARALRHFASGKRLLSQDGDVGAPGGIDPCPPQGPQAGLLESISAALAQLGLGFLTPFLQAASPSLASLLEDIPLVSGYIFRLVGSGLAPLLAGPGGDLGAVLSDATGGGLGAVLSGVIGAASSALTLTDTGSVVSSYLLQNYGTDLVPMATAGSAAEALEALSRSPLFAEATSPEGSGRMSAAGNDLSQYLVAEVVAPGGRLSPLGLVTDLAATALDVVESLLSQSEVLRGGSDAAGALGGLIGETLTGPAGGGSSVGPGGGPSQPDYQMSSEEYEAMCRMKDSLSPLLGVLRRLSSFLDIGRAAGPSGSSSWPGASTPGSSPGPSNGGGGGWWSSPGPSPSPSRGGGGGGGAGGRGWRRYAFVRALWSAADGLGLTFLTDFVEDALPAIGSILSDTGVAADFTFKMIRDGMSEAFFDGRDRLSQATLAILRRTLRTMADTTTGSVIGAACLKRGVDLRDLARTETPTELAALLQRSVVWQLGAAAATEPGWTAGAKDAAQILYSVTDVVRRLLYETVSPWGRLTPLGMAQEVTDIGAAFVQGVVDNGALLRQGLRRQHRMTGDEWRAFGRLTKSFTRLRNALSALNDHISRPAPTVASPSPPPSAVISPLPYVPWGGGPGSAIPPTSFPAWSPAPSSHNAAGEALTSAADKLGVRFVITFAQTAYPAVRDILADGPIAASYLYKLLERGLSPDLADPSGQAAGCLHRILQSFFSRLADTDVGGVVLRSTLERHDIDLPSLASAADLSELLSALRRGSWLQSGWEVAGRVDGSNLGPLDVVLSALNAVWEIVSEAYSPYGRLDPVVLAADLSDVSLALVGATVAEADTLTRLADSELRMDGQEYWALWRMRTSLASLRFALWEMSGTLHGRL